MLAVWECWGDLTFNSVQAFVQHMLTLVISLAPLILKVKCDCVALNTSFLV